MSVLLSRKVNEYNISKQSFLNPCACLKFPLNEQRTQFNARRFLLSKIKKKSKTKQIGNNQTLQIHLPLITELKGKP